MIARRRLQAQRLTKFSFGRCEIIGVEKSCREIVMRQSRIRIQLNRQAKLADRLRLAMNQQQSLAQVAVLFGT